MGVNERSVHEFQVEEVIERRPSILLKLKEISDRTEAERMVGQMLFTPDSVDRKAPKGSFFVDDLIGCNVVSTEGKAIGTIREVMKMPAQDIWSIRIHGKDHWLPAVKEFVKNVDLENRIVTIEVIDGLFDY